MQFLLAALCPGTFAISKMKKLDMTPFFGLEILAHLRFSCGTVLRRIT
jgi:hypothetical protein